MYIMSIHLILNYIKEILSNINNCVQIVYNYKKPPQNIEWNFQDLKVKCFVKTIALSFV